jgi:hypothetical protein
MTFATRPRWLAVGGAILIAAIAADSLVPVAWQIRTGLHWLTEHFLAYLTVTVVLSLALQRPAIVAGGLMAFAAIMEALQGLTADRIPDLPTAFCGAAGVVAGALLARLLIGLFERRRAAQPEALGR